MPSLKTTSTTILPKIGLSFKRYNLERWNLRFKKRNYFNRKYLSRALFLFLFITCNTGCSRFIKTSAPTDEKADRLASLLKDGQHTPTTIKGIGTLKINNQKSVVSFRIAWMGKKPAQLRVETLGLPGRPAVKLAGNGKYFYLNYMVDGHHDFLSYKSENPSLEQFLAIDIKTNDLVALLTGQMPIRGYCEAHLNDDSNNHRILTLTRRFFGMTQKIFLQASHDRPYRIENYDVWGNIIYNVDLTWPDSYNTFEIPSQIMLSNAKGESVTLKIQKFWPNIDIEASHFQLSPAE